MLYAPCGTNHTSEVGVRSAAANMSPLPRSSSESRTSCVTLPSSRPLHDKHQLSCMLISRMQSLPTCISDGLLWFKISMPGRVADSTYVHVAPTLHCTALTAVPNFARMSYVNVRVGTCPIAYLCSAGVRLHLGTQGQMPPAFLVLHAPMSCILLVQDTCSALPLLAYS